MPNMPTGVGPSLRETVRLRLDSYVAARLTRRSHFGLFPFAFPQINAPGICWHAKPVLPLHELGFAGQFCIQTECPTCTDAPCPSVWNGRLPHESAQSRKVATWALHPDPTICLRTPKKINNDDPLRTPKKINSDNVYITLRRKNVFMVLGVLKQWVRSPPIVEVTGHLHALVLCRVGGSRVKRPPAAGGKDQMWKQYS